MVGVEHLMEAVIEGDDLVLDGSSGIVYVNPSAEVEREYQLSIRRYDAFRKELMVGLDEPAATRDGHRVQMLANIALLPTSSSRCIMAPRAWACCDRSSPF